MGLAGISSLKTRQEDDSDCHFTYLRERMEQSLHLGCDTQSRLDRLVHGQLQQVEHFCEAFRSREKPRDYGFTSTALKEALQEDGLPYALEAYKRQHAPQVRMRDFVNRCLFPDTNKASDATLFLSVLNSLDLCRKFERSLPAESRARALLHEYRKGVLDTRSQTDSLALLDSSDYQPGITAGAPMTRFRDLLSLLDNEPLAEAMLGIRPEDAQCKLDQLDASIDAYMTKSWWNTGVGDAYEAIRQQDTLQIKDYLITALGLDQTKRLLDVGGGSGYLGHMLGDAIGEYDLAEVSTQACERARKRDYKARAMRTHRVNADRLEALEQDGYDAITALRVVAHIDVPRFVDNAYRLLKQGGRIVISIPKVKWDRDRLEFTQHYGEQSSNDNQARIRTSMDGRFELAEPYHTDTDVYLVAKKK